jgi:uncharacterized membrane protein
VNDLTPGNFRWRGREIARVEALSDAVFGFAVTLLVVSLEVPKTFGELKHEMRGFLAFGICFTLLILIWHEQHTFFRRYGLQDTKTTVLNCCLLFVVLFYVYPLKFMFTMLTNTLLGTPHLVETSPGVMEPVISTADLPILMIIFGLGYMAVFLLFAAMYYRAFKMRDALELTEIERFDTRESIFSSLISAGVAVASISFAAWMMAIGKPSKAGFAGTLYPILMAPALTIFYTIMGIKRRKLEHAIEPRIRQPNV